MFTTVKGKEKLSDFKIMNNEHDLYILKTKIFNRIDDLNFLCPILLDNNHDIIYMLVKETMNSWAMPEHRLLSITYGKDKILDYFSSKNNKIGDSQLYSLQEAENETYGN